MLKRRGPATPPPPPLPPKRKALEALAAPPRGLYQTKPQPSGVSSLDVYQTKPQTRGASGLDVYQIKPQPRGVSGLDAKRFPSQNASTDKTRPKNDLPKNPPVSLLPPLSTKNDAVSSTMSWRRARSMSLDLLPSRSRRKTMVVAGEEGRTAVNKLTADRGPRNEIALLKLFYSLFNVIPLTCRLYIIF